MGYSAMLFLCICSHKNASRDKRFMEPMIRLSVLADLVRCMSNHTKEMPDHRVEVKGLKHGVIWLKSFLNHVTPLNIKYHIQEHKPINS